MKVGISGGVAMCYDCLWFFLFPKWAMVGHQTFHLAGHVVLCLLRTRGRARSRIGAAVQLCASLCTANRAKGMVEWQGKD